MVPPLDFGRWLMRGMSRIYADKRKRSETVGGVTSAQPKPVKQTSKPSSNAGQAAPDPKQYIKKFMGKNYGKMGEDQYTREIQKAWKNQYGTDLSDDVVSSQVQGALKYYASQAQAKPGQKSDTRNVVEQPRQTISEYREPSLLERTKNTAEKFNEQAQGLLGLEEDDTFWERLAKTSPPVTTYNTVVSPAIELAKEVIQPSPRLMPNTRPDDPSNYYTPQRADVLGEAFGSLASPFIPQDTADKFAENPTVGNAMGLIATAPFKAAEQEPLNAAMGWAGVAGFMKGGTPRGTAPKTAKAPPRGTPKPHSSPSKTKVAPKPQKPGKATPNTLDTFTDEGLEILNQVYENNKKYGPHIAKEQSNLQAHVKARKAASVAETPGQAGEKLSLGESVVGDTPTSPQASPKGAKTVEGVRKGEQARTQPKAQTKPVNPLWETKPGENLNQWADRLFDENKPRCEIRPPDKRHNIGGARVGGKVTPKNSVFDPGVDIAADIKAIHEGLGKRNGNAVKINGREYMVKPGQNGKSPMLYPNGGEGVNVLSKLEYQALAVYNKYGDTPQAMVQIRKRGIPLEAAKVGFETWQRRMK